MTYYPVDDLTAVRVIFCLLPGDGCHDGGDGVMTGTDVACDSYSIARDISRMHGSRSCRIFARKHLNFSSNNGSNGRTLFIPLDESRPFHFYFRKKLFLALWKGDVGCIRSFPGTEVGSNTSPSAESSFLLFDTVAFSISQPRHLFS